jgi:DNA-binding transcriptional LysR family regulator
LRDELLPAYRQIERAVDNASAAYAGLGGVLRVGFTAPWSGDLIVRAADTFHSRHPRCAVELQEVTFGAATAALRDEDVDLLVAEPPVVEPGIVVGPVLFSERRALVVPATHSLAGQKSVSREDLAILPLVTAAGVSQGWHDAFYPRRTPRGRPIAHGRAAVGWQEMLSLVGAGKGATVGTVRAGQYYARPDVAFVPFDDAPAVDHALMWREVSASAATRALVRTILELASPATAERA